LDPYLLHRRVTSGNSWSTFVSSDRYLCRIWLRGGLPGKENAKRIQGFTNQWGLYNKYPSFIDNEDITCMWNMKYVGQKLK
jgi:hypothetical protein